MSKLRVGIIGAGSISKCHMEAYQRLEQVEVVAVCDINEERAKEYAKEYGIPHVFTDYQEMLGMKDLDAVSVTTWNNSHGCISVAALQAGKHVLCEKPLAMNAAEALEMEKASRATGKLLMVGFVRRFGENTKILKESVESGELGKVYYAKAGYIRRWGNPGGWFSDKKRSGGGPVIDLGVHMIDLIRYLNGKPKAVSVFASTFHHLGMNPGVKGIPKYYSADYEEFNDVEDGATTIIKFENGLTLFFETSWVLYAKEDQLYLNLYGDKAGVQMEPEIAFYEERNQYLAETKPVVDPASYSFMHNFYQEIEHFVDCITKGTACINPVEDGVELMKILDAIYESSRTGHEVILQ